MIFANPQNRLERNFFTYSQKRIIANISSHIVLVRSNSRSDRNCWSISQKPNQ